MYQYETDHLKRLRDHLGECTVLLKSDGQFPLSSPCPISLYGSGARHTVKGGTGSGEVNSRYFVNVEQGLQDAGFTITTSRCRAIPKQPFMFSPEIPARAMTGIRKKATSFSPIQRSVISLNAIADIPGLCSSSI